MSLRQRISGWLATPLQRAHCRKLSQGDHLSFPLPLWRKMPVAVQNWCAYKVLGPSEEFAVELVRRHEVLGRFYGPNESSWALSPPTLLYLWQQVVDRKPKRIVEFGTGLSTLLFASHAKLSSGQDDDTRASELSSIPVTICSIDHDADWLENTRGKLQQLGLDSYVQLIHAPLVEQELLGRPRVTYQVARTDLQAAASPSGFDLCLIDGPGRFGRSGCLPLVEPFLSPGALVLLDDALRFGEQNAWMEWSTRWRNTLKHSRLLPTYKHGLAVAEWQPKENMLTRKPS